MATPAALPASCRRGQNLGTVHHGERLKVQVQLEQHSKRRWLSVVGEQALLGAARQFPTQASKQATACPSPSHAAPGHQHGGSIAGKDEAQQPQLVRGAVHCVDWAPACSAQRLHDLAKPAQYEGSTSQYEGQNNFTASQPNDSS
jgi:hypothetical protein